MLSLKQYLIKENHAKILNILRGDVPEVKTMAIMTAWNPLGQQVSAAENNRLNVMLKNRLKESNFNGFSFEKSIYGQYGNLEKGFLIPHISKEFSTQLAADFCQKAIIFGVKKQSENPYVEFQWIETSATKKSECTPESYHVTQTRNVVISGQEAQQRTDYYSSSPHSKKSTPRKFWIPFFDDAYDSAEYSDEKRKINIPNQKINDPISLQKAESIIDLNVSFVLENISKSDKVKNIIEEVKYLENEIYSDKTEKHKWICRGNLNLLMKELTKHID